ncbi:flagellar assembly protein FliW [Paenibacillus sp. PsM32]|uniref:flagellar assembly protein FliW n=1 Tax=Paenibacillus sp. PsM32 TaxID=3030536 RepID=UPI00263BD3D1|nr:flagellar assembly protein FliW [Paenibacillus sp. PsM32]MDN4620372.1 flagellar assembly protein FliW [Paenibacillus sp. PsM32]
MTSSSISSERNTNLKENNYTFPKGIPGFPEFTEYQVIPQYESFSLLQSVDNELVGFIVVDPFIFYPTYEFELPKDVQEELHIESEDQVAIRCIVTWNSVPEQITINLVAPIIFNINEQEAKQIILQTTSYTTKHSLYAGNTPKGEA